MSDLCCIRCDRVVTEPWILSENWEASGYCAACLYGRPSYPAPKADPC